ncbi:hypothetical protein ACHAPT_010859 [Fusarium lateritium]
MLPLAAKPPQEYEDESERDDAQDGDGPAVKKTMKNTISSKANPEKRRSSTTKRGRPPKTPKHKASEQQDPPLPSSPQPNVEAVEPGLDLSNLQQMATPILLTASRMAHVPGLGCLFQDEYGIQMLVPYSMLPSQPRPQNIWTTNNHASASQPMTSPGPGFEAYSMSTVDNLQYLNSDPGQHSQTQAVLRSQTRAQPQAQPSSQGPSDDSFTSLSFERQESSPHFQNRN